MNLQESKPEEIVKEIRRLINIQKTNPPASDEWKNASKDLHACYAHMEKIDPKGEYKAIIHHEAGRFERT